MPHTAVSAPFGDDDQRPPPDTKAAQAHEPEDDRPIESLDLSVRAYNCLKRSRIDTIGQLLALTHDELLSVRNFRERCYGETRAKLIELGIMTADQPIGPFRE